MRIRRFSPILVILPFLFSLEGAAKQHSIATQFKTIRILELNGRIIVDGSKCSLVVHEGSNSQISFQFFRCSNDIRSLGGKQVQINAKVEFIEGKKSGLIIDYSESVPRLPIPGSSEIKPIEKAKR